MAEAARTDIEFGAAFPKNIKLQIWMLELVDTE
jgi:hypothetical protein